jgi:hypothetical protein
MKNMKFFIASPWRNKDKVQELTDELIRRGYGVYSFLENGANFSTGRSAVEELAVFSEAVEKWESDPRIKNIFDSEMEGLRGCDAVVLMEPAGRSSLLEAGIGYGMGKKVFVIGPIERAEVVYRISEHFYPDRDAFLLDFPAQA